MPNSIVIRDSNSLARKERKSACCAIEVSGADELQALDAVTRLISDGFGER